MISNTSERQERRSPVKLRTTDLEVYEHRVGSEQVI